MTTSMGLLPSLRTCLALCAVLLLCASPVAAFGAGNIPSISEIEGRNWRHGDIEDMLKTIAFIKGNKWTSMMIKRVYFGNWLRDYSQAMDVGSLKGVQAGTVRLLVWVLSFLSFGYATREFEVTDERLGVYRPEEHIDNPKDYADNADARKFDPRLRPPVEPIELEVDPETGMKNYIANEKLEIATSVGYVKFSFARSIHFGRVYTSGSHSIKGKEADLCEALRCLGQGLHCLEDFGAHTNYTELALREMGYKDVFPHVGTATEITLRGKHRVFPLVTGTFGVVDFLHSVLGEATDHFTQSEVEQMDVALKDAEAQNGDGTRSTVSTMTHLLGNVPGAGDLARQADDLQARSTAQEQENRFAGIPGTTGEAPMQNIPGTKIDPYKTAAQIYPILEFRDNVVKMLTATYEKIPGLEALVTRITDTLTLFILSLLAPYIRPIINAVSKQLQSGSGGVIDASGKHQYEPWDDPHCTDPTHSLLSKDHFSNILNQPAGLVASSILQYVAPRVIYAWQHPDIPVDEVMNDISRAFHHPALRDRHCELHNNMYSAVERWVHSRPDKGANLNVLLGSNSVRHGKNHTVDPSQQDQGHSHGGLPSNTANFFGNTGNFFGAGSQNKTRDSPWEQIDKVRDAGGLGTGGSGISTAGDNIPAAFPGTQTQFDTSRPPTGPDFGYPSQPEQPPQQQYPSYPPQGPQYYGQPPQWQPGLQSPPPPIYPPQRTPSPQFPQYGYSGAPPYGQAPPQPYGYGAPPPEPYYGGPY